MEGKELYVSIGKFQEDDTYLLVMGDNEYRLTLDTLVGITQYFKRYIDKQVEKIEEERKKEIN